MKYRAKLNITAVLLIISITVCFAVPKPKYTSLNILSKIQIPYTLKRWQGHDIAEKLNLQDYRYRFINNVFARVYLNKYGQTILLLILDAGNFHHPKVCFGSSGFKVKELNDVQFNLSGRKLKAHTLYAEKGKESFLLIYWININKKIVNWEEQKLKQLWFSLFNKKKSGLMIRLDIPTNGNNIESSLQLARDFLEDMTGCLPQESADYIFGKAKKN